MIQEMSNKIYPIPSSIPSSTSQSSTSQSSQPIQSTSPKRASRKTSNPPIVYTTTKNKHKNKNTTTKNKNTTTKNINNNNDDDDDDDYSDEESQSSDVYGEMDEQFEESTQLSGKRRQTSLVSQSINQSITYRKDGMFLRKNEKV